MEVHGKCVAFGTRGNLLTYIFYPPRVAQGRWNDQFIESTNNKECTSLCPKKIPSRDEVTRVGLAILFCDFMFGHIERGAKNFMNTCDMVTGA